MKYVIKIFTFFSIFLCLTCKCYAINYVKTINPDWINYIKSSIEEQKEYTIIPEQYIYETDEKIVPFSNNKYKSINDIVTAETLPKYFNLTNYNNENYVNSTRSQSSLGLCWAFAGYGSFESSMLHNGVTGVEENISLCDEYTSPNSKYCTYKKDNLQNKEYITNSSSENVSFSERQLDYVRTAPSDVTPYNSSTKMDPILEKYNPYTLNMKLGGGGNFKQVLELLSYGVVPRKKVGNWTNYTVNNETVTLNQLFDYTDNLYTVSNAYIMGYKGTAKDITNLKQRIMNYGSAYVSLNGIEGKCRYIDNKYDEKNTTYLWNAESSCTGSHAVQLIGWDDNYQYEYCKMDNSTSDSYTQSSCEDSGYTWISGNGAWIIRNSWANIMKYVYVTYDSIFTEVGGIKNVKATNYDNVYTKKNSIYTNTWDYKNKTYIRKYYTTNNSEYITSVNFTVNYGEYEAYLSNDGENYQKIGSGTVDANDLITIETNFKVTNNKFYIKLEKVSTDSDINVFTKNECSVLNNCNDLPEVNSILKNYYYNSSQTEFNVFTRTKNINSGEQLIYKIYDKEDNDVTNLFDIENNYVVYNSNSAKIVAKESLKEGKYKIKTIFDNYSDEIEFYILNDIMVKIDYGNLIFKEDSVVKANSEILNNSNIYNIKWSTSDTTIATVNNEGILSLLDSGKVTISIEAESKYGDINLSQDLVIYDKIRTVDDFFNIFKYEKNTHKAYYLVNDLDFKNADFNEIDTNIIFYGVFNGGFHKIFNVNREGSNDSGLFIQLYGANIENLKIVDSTFTGGRYAGSLAGYSINSTVNNIYSNSIIHGVNSAGGIIGTSSNTIIDGCFNEGKVETISTRTSALAGGIVGNANTTQITNSYNIGNINAETSWKKSGVTSSISSGGGIIGRFNTSSVSNSYNTGKITSTNTSSNGQTYKSGIVPLQSENMVTNSYYLEDDSYTSNYDNQSKTLEELKNKDTFVDWDFIHVWNINNDSTPNLRVFSKKIEDIELNVDTNTLNTNSEYIYSYTFTPTDTSGDVNITSSDTNIIEIKDNKLITKDKTGSVKININVDNIKKEYTFEVVNILDYSYTKEYTNKDIDINFNINYYLTKLNNEYLKLIYGINNELKTIIFDKEKNIINDTIKIDKNGLIKLELYKCNDESCEIITSKEENIIYIDKDKPIIEYNLNTNDKSLIINIYDNTTGLKDNNVYEYAISNSNKTKPNSLTKYKINEKITNLPINYNNKYLWIKNVYDLSNNGICDEEYCVYDLKINRMKYKVKYYDEDKQTILKEEEYLEDDILNVTYIPTKETEEYNYKFIKWDGYENNMKVTKDINLYAVYEKVRKELISDVYIIENGYIKNIKLNNIKEVYNIDKFKSNIKGLEDYEYYENNKKIEEPKYIKTGQVIKNINKEYKLVLTGDVTKDGYVKMNDIMKIANHIVNGNVLKEETYYAADINNDGKIKMNDLMKIADVIVNGGSL